jgi:hypothetical protein
MKPCMTVYMYMNMEIFGGQNFCQAYLCIAVLCWWNKLSPICECGNGRYILCAIINREDKDTIPHQMNEKRWRNLVKIFSWWKFSRVWYRQVGLLNNLVWVNVLRFFLKFHASTGSGALCFGDSNILANSLTARCIWVLRLGCLVVLVGGLSNFIEP